MKAVNLSSMVKIPGFAGYFFNQTDMNIYSFKQNTPKVLASNGSGGYMLSEGGRTVSVTIGQVKNMVEQSLKKANKKVVKMVPWKRDSNYLINVETKQVYSKKSGKYLSVTSTGYVMVSLKGKSYALTPSRIKNIINNSR